MRSLIIISLFMIFSVVSLAQTTIIGNNSSTSTDYLGWDNGTPFSLNVKHEGNRSILFSTNNTLRLGILNSGHVLAGTTAPLDNGLLSILVPGIADTKYGLHSTANGIDTKGGLFIGDNASVNLGLVGTAESPLTFDLNVGIYGNACTWAENGLAAGIYGYIPPECTGTSWAGYFEGQTFTSAGVWSGSDLMLKTAIAPLTGCIETLTNLSPKQYYFAQPDGVEINLPQGLQFGLIAQELQSVLPHAVTEVTHGMRLESLNLGMDQEFSFLGVNYTQLLPLIVGAFQENQLQLYAQMEMLMVQQQIVEEAEMNLAILLAE